MLMKLCTYPGCNCLVSNGTRCPKHKAEKKTIFTQRTKSREYHNLYQSARWRKTRREFLRENPFCIKCGQPSEIADHIIPHRGNEDLFYDKNNLQPMCWKCHSAKTLQENNFFHKKKRQGEGG
ncbi:HNH endonuclease [Treponema ruminis]|uniref:5-methylcytosine-specific restriction protein A n=1 Tax=Treponema ruminis TaxID=744515 RepID=A0A7W8LNA9_9SPIR|nr:5-methylcytosine-specific restriction protein A [Treponema ruminis]QSI01214.1 HNH endonuclease [Treponema ruminis]